MRNEISWIKQELIDLIRPKPRMVRRYNIEKHVWEIGSYVGTRFIVKATAQFEEERLSS